MQNGRFFSQQTSEQHLWWMDVDHNRLRRSRMSDDFLNAHLFLLDSFTLASIDLYAKRLRQFLPLF
jgi:hypothetical protein